MKLVKVGRRESAMARYSEATQVAPGLSHDAIARLAIPTSEMMIKNDSGDIGNVLELRQHPRSPEPWQASPIRSI